MRVLYGVVGEGMGHATRSAVILEALLARGHDVRIVVSGRAADFLAARYPDRVTRITGLTMVYEDNVVKKLKSAFQNLKAARGLPDNMEKFLEMARDFVPDVVISDFESWTYLFAKSRSIPIISVDNMQIISRCEHDDAVIGDERKDFRLARNLVRAKLPRCNAYLVTTFFYPAIDRERTTLHPPILRDVVLDARAQRREDEHVLVYQTGPNHGALVDELKQVQAEFRVYGMRRDIKEAVTEGNVTFCPFSEAGFIRDLATARAVVAGGGFTLMGEAVYLGKPMLVVPLVGQFEQALNANYLRELGYGERVKVVTAEAVGTFLARAPRYRDNLAEFEHDRNQGLLDTLESTMQRVVAEGAREL